jgi:hypothetical protein
MDKAQMASENSEKMKKNIFKKFRKFGNFFLVQEVFFFFKNQYFPWTFARSNRSHETR